MTYREKCPMSIKDIAAKFGVAPGHTEPDGQLDKIDRENDPLYTQPDADAAAKRALTGDTGNVL